MMDLREHVGTSSFHLSAAERVFSYVFALASLALFLVALLPFTPLYSYADSWHYGRARWYPVIAAGLWMSLGLLLAFRARFERHVSGVLIGASVMNGYVLYVLIDWYLLS